MKITGPQVISELREQLKFDVGRHLYGLLGTYAQLQRFAEADLGPAIDQLGNPFPAPININRRLLARIGDNDLRRLVRDEPRRPKTVQRRLGQELDALLAELLLQHPFLVAHQLELAFAYQLDLAVFRTRATNQNHILLLLPGERRANHIMLFHEVNPSNHRSLPTNLIADNHLWELRDD